MDHTVLIAERVPKKHFQISLKIKEHYSGLEKQFYTFQHVLWYMQWLQTRSAIYIDV